MNRRRSVRPLAFALLATLSSGFATLAACVEGPHRDDTGGTPDKPDAVDCEPGDGLVEDVEATLTDIPTVVRVTWRTAVETVGAVHFDTATGPRETAPSFGTEHEVLLVGNRANTPVPYRIVTEADGAVTCGEPRSITTGALPVGLPDLTVSFDPEHVGEGFTIVPVIQQRASFVALLDSGGQYVWAWQDPEYSNTGAYFNADVDLGRTGIFANEQALSADRPGAIRHIGFDGAALPAVEIPGGHTDFVELPDGSIASLSWDLREVDGTKYLGDRIVEVSADGVARTIWSVWDHYAPDPEQDWPTGYYIADRTVRDWSHVNAIGYDADADAFLLSMPFDQSVARVERSTGEMTWVIAGEGLVDAPHSVQPLGDAVLVFNRAQANDPSACSEATEIDLATREVVWSYRSERCLLIPYLGGARRLPNGDTLVDWSSAGQLDEVTPDGELSWRVNLNLGAAFGFADRVGSLYAE